MRNFILLLLIMLTSCSSSSDEGYKPIENVFEELNLPETYFNYANIELPAHYKSNNFPAQFQFQYAAIKFDNTPADNPITDAGATLGRILFYDKKLSANNTISCASCHQQKFGFSDPRVLSEGFDKDFTRRHSMGLVNSRFYFSGKFFWDERAGTLEEQVLQPFQDPVEMGLSLEVLVEIVKNQIHYPSLFKASFGDENVTSSRISKALSQFIRSLVSTTSKYDVARSKVQSPIDDFPDFTNQENMGKKLFFLPIKTINGGQIICAGCHVTEAFVGSIPNNQFDGTTTSLNNGLDLKSTDDLGVFESSKNPRDIGKFKVPSLRNIAIRPPYMHDGRFTTLEEVLNHYSTGIQNHTNLAQSLLMSNGKPIKLNLTKQQKDALIAFLNTLTDHKMIADEKYSDPFK